MQFFPEDWGKVLVPQAPIIESIVRISLVYLALFFLLRVILKRESGGLGISDLLVLVLLADAVQNGMAGQTTSVGDVLILAVTLIFWDWALSFLGYHFPWFYRLIRPKSLVIIENGEINKVNARKELLTRQDIMEELRLQGVQELAMVKKAYIESNGEISIVKQDDQAADQSKPTKPRV